MRVNGDHCLHLLSFALLHRPVPGVLRVGPGGGAALAEVRDQEDLLVMVSAEGEPSADSSGLPRVRWLFQPPITPWRSRPRSHARPFELCLAGWGGRDCSGP